MSQSDVEMKERGRRARQGEEEGGRRKREEGRKGREDEPNEQE